MKSFRTKIILTYVLVSSFVILGLGVVVSLEIESYLRAKLVTGLSEKVDGVAGVLREQPLSAADEVDRLIKVQAQAEHIRITLIDSSGVVVADSDVPFEGLKALENHSTRPEIISAARTGYGENVRHSASVNRDFLYVAKRLGTPLELRNAQIFYVRVSAHVEEIAETVSDIRRNILVACVVVMVLGAGVGIVLSRQIAQPLVDIARAAKRIQEGDLDHRIRINSADEMGQVAEAVNALVDTLKTDIAQLRKLERYRTEFLGNVSHELRTPIFSIQGYIETLLGGAVDDPAVNKSFLKKAHDQAGRLNALLEDLIDISRIESGEMKMSFRYFRLKDFLDLLRDDSAAEGERNRVHVVVDSDLPENAELYGDKDRLRQAFANLIANGIRYNKPDGSVTISASAAEKGIRFSVKDTGIGIPSDHQSRIFERFYRVDRDRSREVGGTGLGLSIVKHIVEAHKSKVELTSTEGVGSEFSFVLPI